MMNRRTAAANPESAEIFGVALAFLCTSCRARGMSHQVERVDNPRVRLMLPPGWALGETSPYCPECKPIPAPVPAPAKTKTKKKARTA